jgi:hypothetical protein
VYEAEEYPYNDWVSRFPNAKSCKEWINGETGYIIKPVIEVLPVRIALRNARMVIKNLLRDIGTEEYLLLFSSSTNLRNNIAILQPYKGNRTEDSKPKLYSEIKEFLYNNYHHKVVEGYEADDLLAIYYNEFDHNLEGKAVIVSQDKDLSQVPGWHWNMGTEEHSKYSKKGEKFFISEEEGLKNFYKQLLTGDATDTIPGLYQITGEKCKKQYLQSIDIWFDTEINLNLLDKNAYWNIVRPLYSKFIGEAFRYEDMEDLNCILWEIANLLYLRRSFDDKGWEIPV